MYYLRMTIFSPHLTEIVPIHDRWGQPQKQVRIHIHVAVQQPEQPKGGSSSSRDRFFREKNTVQQIITIK